MAKRVVLELGVEAAKFFRDLDTSEERVGALTKKFTEAGRDIKKWGQDVGELGRSLSVNVTAPIVALVGSMTALAVSTANTGDAIAKNARTAGLSAESYQELAFAIGQVSDVTEDQLVKGFARFSTVIGDAVNGNKAAIASLKELGFTQAEIRAGTITTEEAFDRLSVKVQEVGSSAEAAALAGDLLGDRVGPKLAGAIRASGDEVDRLRTQFRDLGLAMSDEALAQSEAFNDNLDLLKNQFMALGREIGGQLLPIFNQQLVPLIQEKVIPAIRSFTEWVASVITWFTNLSGRTQAIITILGGLAAAAGPVLIAFGAIVSALAPIVTWIGRVIPLVVTFSLRLATMGQAALLSATRLSTVPGPIGAIGRAAGGATTALNTLRGIIAPLSLAVVSIGTGFILAKRDMDRYLESVTEANRQAERQRILLEAYKKVTGDTKAVQIDFTRLTDEQQAKLLEMAKAAEQSALNLGKTFTIMKDGEGAAKKSAAAIEENEEALKALEKRLQSLGETMSGVALQREVNEVAMAIQRLGGVQRITAGEQKKLAERAYEWARAGATLPPVLKQIWLENVSLAGSLGLVADGFKSVIDTTDTVPEVAERWEQMFGKDSPLQRGIAGMGPGIIEAVLKPDEDFSDRLQQSWAQLFERIKPMAVRLHEGLLAATSGLPSVLMQALTGGGDVGKAVGGHVGGSIFSSLTGVMDEAGKFLGGIGGFLQKHLGKTIGGLIGSIIPGLGTLLGSGIGTLFSKVFGGLFGKEGAKVNDIRDQFVGQFAGGLDEIHGKLIAIGREDLFKALAFGPPKIEAIERAIRNVTKALEEQEQKLIRQNELIDQLEGAVIQFGGVAPKSLRPMVEELLKSAGLTEEMRRALEGMLKQPTWQTLQAAAEKYGVSLEALGSNFQQAKLTDEAIEIANAFDMLTLGLEHTNDVARGFKDEVQDLIDRSRQFGIDIPERMRPLIEQLLLMGELTDENGDKLEDLDGLTFSGTLEDGLEGIKDVLEEIRDFLLFGLQGPAQQGARAIQDAFRDGIDVPVRFQKGDLPGPIEADFDVEPRNYQGGTRNLDFESFGRATPANLHNDEAVIPRGHGHELASEIAAALGPSMGGGGAVTLQLHIAGKRIADVLLPDFIRSLKRNDGRGAPVSPLTDLRTTLGLA